MHTERFQRLRAWASARGMGLVGAVDRAAFDCTQPRGRRAGERMPECDTIVLLGTGGRGGWEAVCKVAPPGPPDPRRHPIDDWSAAIADDAIAWFAAEGFVARSVLPSSRDSLNFRQLGELVGFGTISPVTGQLLHPTFGPWLSLRVALLAAGQPFGARSARPTTDFQPCPSCSKPCVSACPVGTFDGIGGVFLEHCAGHRVAGHCGDGCASLRACPIGAEHRYGDDEQRHRQAHALFAMQRRNGGWLGMVAGLVRRRT